MHVVITQAVNPDGKRTPTCVAPAGPDEAFHDFHPIADVSRLLVCTRCAAQAEFREGDPPARPPAPGPTPRASWRDTQTSARVEDETPPTRLALRDDPDA